MDFENVEEVLRELESEFPSWLLESELKEKSDLSSEEFAPISSYLTEQEYVETHSGSNTEGLEYKITHKGIDFLREREKRKTEAGHNSWLVIATIALVIASLLTAVTTWYNASPKVFYATGSLNCPETLERNDISNFDPSFLNNGDNPALLEWNLDNSSVLVTGGDTNDAINIKPHGEYELNYNLIIPRDPRGERPSFTFHYSKPNSLIPFGRVSDKAVCKYEKFKEGDEYDEEYELVAGTYNERY